MKSPIPVSIPSITQKTGVFNFEGTIIDRMSWLIFLVESFVLRSIAVYELVPSSLQRLMS